MKAWRKEVSVKILYPVQVQKNTVLNSLVGIAESYRKVYSSKQVEKPISGSLVCMKITKGNKKNLNA